MLSVSLDVIIMNAVSQNSVLLQYYIFKKTRWKKPISRQSLVQCSSFLSADNLRKKKWTYQGACIKYAQYIKVGGWGQTKAFTCPQKDFKLLTAQTLHPLAAGFAFYVKNMERICVPVGRIQVKYDASAYRAEAVLGKVWTKVAPLWHMHKQLCNEWMK